MIFYLKLNRMMLLTHKWGKPISVKMRTQILFELSASMCFYVEKMRKNHNVQQVK